MLDDGLEIPFPIQVGSAKFEEFDVNDYSHPFLLGVLNLLLHGFPLHGNKSTFSLLLIEISDI